MSVICVPTCRLQRVEERERMREKTKTKSASFRRDRVRYEGRKTKDWIGANDGFAV